MSDGEPASVLPDEQRTDGGDVTLRPTGSGVKDATASSDDENEESAQPVVQGGVDHMLDAVALLASGGLIMQDPEAVEAAKDKAADAKAATAAAEAEAKEEEEAEKVLVTDLEDEATIETRRKEKEKHLADMAAIEGEYAKLKGRLYQQRLNRVEESLKRVKEGRLGRFKQQRRALEAERERQLKLATRTMESQVSNAGYVLEFTRSRAQNDLGEHSRLQKERMIAHLEWELACAERDKKAVDAAFVPTPDPVPVYDNRVPPDHRLSHQVHGQPNLGMQHQRSQKRAWNEQPHHMQAGQPYYDPYAQLHQQPAPQPRKRRKQKQPTVTRTPYIVYQLRDGDVMEDLRAFTPPTYAPHHVAPGYYPMQAMPRQNVYA